MNCCGGTEHKHGDYKQNNDQHDHGDQNPSWLPIAALLLVGVLVAGLLLTFIK